MSRSKWLIVVLLVGYGLACYFAICGASLLLDRPLSVKWELRAQAISVLFACVASLIHLSVRARSSLPRRGFEVISAARERSED